MHANKAERLIKFRRWTLQADMCHAQVCRCVSNNFSKGTCYSKVLLLQSGRENVIIIWDYSHIRMLLIQMTCINEINLSEGIIKKSEKLAEKSGCPNVPACVCLHSRSWVGSECYATYGSQLNWLTFASPLALNAKSGRSSLICYTGRY